MSSLQPCDLPPESREWRLSSRHSGWFNSDASLIARHSTPRDTDPNVTCVCQRSRQDNLYLREKIEEWNASEHRVLSKSLYLRGIATQGNIKVTGEENYARALIGA